MSRNDKPKRGKRKWDHPEPHSTQEDGNQRHHVHTSQLEWKPVAIPDAWKFNDTSARTSEAEAVGFLDLEEIDGVDVEYIKQDNGATIVNFKANVMCL